MTRLERLPAHVDALASQTSHLRAEMRSEFSSVRSEMADQGAALRDEFRTDLRREIDGLATQMRGYCTRNS